ncbi:UvrD-helicase domain-containing protein [Ruicaihuangia caeni]|uniref:UvrD-helicase domain-containing protein n=1 Tax=Ruicaihuangia caeni TaxID=3042517 RepID=UPI00338F6B03
MRTDFDALAAEILDWARGFFDDAKAHHRDKGWITREFSRAWEMHKPQDPSRLASAPELAEHRAEQPGDVLQALELWSADLQQYVATWNDRFLSSELEEYRSFFDRVEKSPLTSEQARAVVTFDNRVQLVAAAGSGKTSTMIAKAGYALHRGIVSAERILLLAFNSSAADELQQRIDERLTPLGLSADRVMARTFHALGLAIIGQATGRKPSLAPWLGHAGGDVRKVAEIVDHLRDNDPVFRQDWDLFRLVFSADIPVEGDDDPEPDWWDPKSRRRGFRTLNGEIVESHGERQIADWLFYHGVAYDYERRYEHDTTDPDHRQYTPDFYYPDIAVYHEHLAIDEDGVPPATFKGYREKMEWARVTHARYGTQLIETEMHEIRTGEVFEKLSRELTSRGIELDPNPDRPVHGAPPIENERLVTTFRSFMAHAKSNRLSLDDLLARAHSETGRRRRHRHERFLALYKRIRDRWEEELNQHDAIDFEDMLNLAADHIEAGRWDSPFELVMVDEMQDASVARARLMRALTSKPGSYLFAVGDDWQSINQFAGADVSLMTGFHTWFGEGETLQLQRTFRCPQSICDASSGFVMKNQAQLPKQVMSNAEEYPPSLIAIAADSDAHVYTVIRKHLAELNDRIGSGIAPAGGGGKASVFILGRYRHQQSLMPRGAAKQWNHLDVRFSTVHSSKGLEADYVIIPSLTRDGAAFPSRIANDPALKLAMPVGESFRHAEERRLFYVALTRARRSVTLITVAGRESPFLIELIEDKRLPYVTAIAEEIPLIKCSECADGAMVLRTSRHGRFFGCSNFPRCRATMREDAVRADASL